MTREFYRNIVLKMTENSMLDFEVEDIVNRCIFVDKFVRLGNNNSPNHSLVSTQVIAWIVYDYIRNN